LYHFFVTFCRGREFARTSLAETWGFQSQVMQASKMSMGMDVSDMDMANINMFLERVIELSEYRMRLHEYLVNKMDKACPAAS
jgi:RNA processing factor Prp31